jgi:hypothetical protein
VTEKDNLALVRRPPSALEGGVPAAKRIVTLMVTETLALAQGKAQVQSLSSLQPYTRAELESWNQKGESHRWGRGVPQDYAQAVHWFRKAAEQGHAFAQYNLGWCYVHGSGVPQDYAQAVHWFRQGAEQGHAFPQFNLGGCYANGRGVPQDSAQAVHWYRKAAEQGHEFAQHDLGLCYEEGEGILKNAVVACVWLRLAAEQGLVRAKVRFAALSAMMSPNELAESERLYEEYSKRKQS